MSIELELLKTIRKYRRLARANYYIAFSLHFLAIASSITATFVALSGQLTGTWLAAITAVPGAALLLANTLNFSGRARWHYEKKIQLKSLHRLIIAKAPGTSDAEVAEKWNKIDAKMETTWPRLGTVALVGAPSKRTSD
jgi:hypothetical protein